MYSLICPCGFLKSSMSWINYKVLNSWCIIPSNTVSSSHTYACWSNCCSRTQHLHMYTCEHKQIWLRVCYDNLQPLMAQWDQGHYVLQGVPNSFESELMLAFSSTAWSTLLVMSPCPCSPLQMSGGYRYVPCGQSPPQPVPSLPPKEVPPGWNEQGWWVFWQNYFFLPSLSSSPHLHPCRLWFGFESQLFPKRSNNEISEMHKVTKLFYSSILYYPLY